MNGKFYPLKSLLMAILLWCMGSGVQAQVLNLNKSVVNVTTGGNGTVASQGDILQYTITVTSLSADNFTNTRLYDNIPAGTAYVANSTYLNGGPPVPDASGGRMPFASAGGLINSSGYGPGIIAPNVNATIIFRVRVTANGGGISNYATLDGTYNTISHVQTTNTVTTSINADPTCNLVWQTNTNGAGHYRLLRTLNTSDGTSTIIYNGAGTSGVQGLSRNAVSGAWFSNGTAFGTSAGVGVAAIAYERSTDRLYYINNDNDPQPYLSFIDSVTTSVTAHRTAKVIVGARLETNTDDAYNINRMTFASDGYGYALTSNCLDLIRFTVNPATNAATINRLGPLINDAVNGSVNVLSEGGGDIFADGSGKLYMIVNSSRLYKINPNTRVATYMGTVTPPFDQTPPDAEPSQSMAIDAAGTVYIGGAYNRIYRLDLSTMARISIPGGTQTSNGDFASCGFPVLNSSIVADKTFRNINGSSTVVGGDTVEYIITVENRGNFNAAGVKMYDYIPPGTHYLPGTTYLNGVFIPDVSGTTMPYAVTGGRLVNSPGESGGILKPGLANRAVVTFRVRTEPNREVCNQSKITLLDADGNIIFVNSSDGSPGTTPTCFYVDNVILPLTGLKFKGNLNNNQSVLQWSLREDENTVSYEVEYSENGTSFTTVGRVAAKGIITAENTYQFTDRDHTISGLRYYRLKVIQKDGKFIYSGIITLDVKGQDIQVVPNPFDKDLNLQVRLTSSELISIRVLDTYGRSVYAIQEQLAAGTNSISIRLPASLPSGMYMLKVLSGKNELYTKKLLKK